MTKKSFLIILSILVLSLTVNAEELTLDCKYTYHSARFEVELDYEKSLFRKQKIQHSMILTDNRIKTAMNTSMADYSHEYWEISRATGRGFIGLYLVTDEEFQEVKKEYVTEILLKKIGNLEDKSLDSTRNKVVMKHVVAFFETKKPEKKIEIECEKVEKKF